MTKSRDIWLFCHPPSFDFVKSHLLQKEDEGSITPKP